MIYRIHVSISQPLWKLPLHSCYAARAVKPTTNRLMINKPYENSSSSASNDCDGANGYKIHLRLGKTKHGTSRAVGAVTTSFKRATTFLFVTQEEMIVVRLPCKGLIPHAIEYRWFRRSARIERSAYPAQPLDPYLFRRRTVSSNPTSRCCDAHKLRSRSNKVGLAQHTKRWRREG